MSLARRVNLRDVREGGDWGIERSLLEIIGIFISTGGIR